MKVINKLCSKHGLTVHVIRKDNSSRCRKCEVNRVDIRRKKLKLQAVEHLGGKCSHCQYSNCIEALEFHHVDPVAKDFTLSSSTVMGWEKIKTELKKCILLCANCHREEHVRIKLNKYSASVV